MSQGSTRVEYCLAPTSTKDVARVPPPVPPGVCGGVVAGLGRGPPWGRGGSLFWLVSGRDLPLPHVVLTWGGCFSGPVAGGWFLSPLVKAEAIFFHHAVGLVPPSLVVFDLSGFGLAGDGGDPGPAWIRPQCSGAWSKCCAPCRPWRGGLAGSAGAPGVGLSDEGGPGSGSQVAGF